MSAVSFDDVTVTLGRRQILSGVSFAVEGGDFVAVLGPNGSGKTTMFRVLLGLLPIHGGRVAVLGQAPRRGNPQIGYVPQSRRGAAQLQFTGFEFLLSAQGGSRWGLPVASKGDRKAVEAALERVGARDLGQRSLSEMSGGERQRLFVAQALVGAPKLLLLDEPLISLDPAYQRTIVELVRDVARERGIPVLFSAHEINPLLRAVDKVLYLGNGHAAIGSVDEVINEAVLSSIYGATVRVIRAEGRVFVIAEDSAADGHMHEHDH